MSFIKVGNQVINLNEIVRIDLQAVLGCDECRHTEVMIQLLASHTDEDGYVYPEMMFFDDEAEMAALRRYFSDSAIVLDLMAPDPRLNKFGVDEAYEQAVSSQSN